MTDLRTGSGKKIDALIFDVDGVLLDVSRSFSEVIRRSILDGFVRFCGGEADSEGCTPEHEKIMKRHGAFNDDYDLAWSLLSITAAAGGKKLSQAFPTPEKLAAELESFSGSVREWTLERYGALIPYKEFRGYCDDLYLGTKDSKGLYMLEKPLLHAKWNELPLPAGLYTGRDLKELACAYESLGWEPLPKENVIHRETGICKPSPEGLEILCKRFGAENPLYVGDTASDFKAFKAFGKGVFAAIGSLLPEAENSFADCDEALEKLL